MDKLDVFDEIRRKTHQGGGEEKIEMQHNLNKLTARERILNILDEGSFIEIGTLIDKNGAGVITGHGTINGRLVYIYSEDYTVNGGTFNKQSSKKICNIMDAAVKMGAPMIKIFDSIGGKIDDGIELLASYGTVLRKTAKSSGVIPQISIVSGPCNGTIALNAAMSDFIIMVENSGELSISTSNKLINKEERYVDSSMYSDGASSVKNGNANFVVDDEMEAIMLAKKIFNYIPSNNLEMPCLTCESMDLNEVKENLNQSAINENYSGEAVLREIGDENSILELNKNIDESINTYLIKINGLTVGVMANNDNEKSEINIKLSNKVASFVRLCDSFNIPILSIVDTKGIVINLEEEKMGLAKNVSKIIYALSDATVPKVSLIIGEACGAGYLALASKEASFDVALAWPTAKISLTSPKTIIMSKYREEVLSGDNLKEKEEEILKKYMDEVTNPYACAEIGLLDDIIKPSETKQRIFAILDMLQSKRELNYPKKHGSILI
ncbi:MAG: propionyl-CoA carboxylase [Clostridium argentinense]|uniref:Propionyl-CoA carboxylase n=1 Tax=Clostridium faecium TaxID=2762223 RepID=A0ABR8YW87_9CLOT|nr:MULTISPECIES: carboxyl transferase domain-containing protein [Clostridium]MBD8048538.1 propionyl-CoA carboxylase [Clostridium faecium]MBS5824030.1 propionyl-CoA carboxylase [Clostridium argentinense]MDU1350747.1 carboxyl transferase domain-containing protein [Clostridium argentinense]